MYEIYKIRFDFKTFLRYYTRDKAKGKKNTRNIGEGRRYIFKFYERIIFRST